MNAVKRLSRPKMAGIPIPPIADDIMLTRAFRVLGHGSFQLSAPATSSSAAFQSYTRGRNLLEERTVKAALRAISCFEEAIRFDPNFALAWAGIADAQHVRMEFDHGFREDTFLRARNAAERAVALGPDLPETHIALAAVMQIGWDWEGARLAYERAIQLDPRLARAQRWYAGFLLQLGHVDQALEKTRLALDLDPWDYTAHSAYGGYLFAAGRPQQAFEHLERTLAEKDLISAHINLGVVCAYLTRASKGVERERYLGRALQEADRVRDQETRGADSATDGYTIKWADFIPALAYAYAGDSSEALPWLNRLEEGRLTVERPLLLSPAFTR